MKLHYLFLLFMLSCTSHVQNINNRNGPSGIWDILENSINKNRTSVNIEALLGTPQTIYKDKHHKNVIVWIYNYKVTGNQEWAFRFNRNSKILSTTYLPETDYKSEFTLKKIKERWSKLNCKNKKEQILQPGLIKYLRYVSCNNGRYRIKYNKYNEIISISVRR